jgi:cytochrome P450
VDCDRQAIDTFVARGECDLIADLAVPLPVTVIAELLGVAPEHQADFKRWSDVFVEAGNPPMTPERTRVTTSSTTTSPRWSSAAGSSRAAI